MKNLLVLFFFISSVAGFSQTSGTIKKGEELKKIIVTDSIAKKIKDLNDTVAAATQVSDRKLVNESLSKNFDSILLLQKQQRDKQKRAAWIRIGIGILFLGVLVVGLRRKKK